MYTQPLFNDLNERQLEAVKTTEGRLRIVAGAGCGRPGSSPTAMPTW